MTASPAPVRQDEAILRKVSAAEVDADLAYGQSVDARRIRGAKPFSVFAREVESLLK